jgi:hypothetical protein
MSRGWFPDRRRKPFACLELEVEKSSCVQRLWGREQHVPPRSTDVRHRDEGFVHGECTPLILPVLREKAGDKGEDVPRQSVYGLQD